MPSHPRLLGLAAGALLILAQLSGCAEGGKSPLSPEEQALVGRWRLDLGAVDAGDFACDYDLADDHRVSNRMGGRFLRTLRDLEALKGVDLGRLPNLDAIDGAAVRWDGTWSVDQDSLRFEFDRFQVDAIGTLPLLGEVSVPVYRQELAPAQRVTVAYTYHVNGQLVLRGAAVSAGLATEAVEQQTAALSPLGREVLALVAQTLAAAFRGSDANEYVFVRL